jgi:hypothetical protein
MAEMPRRDVLTLNFSPDTQLDQLTAKPHNLNKLLIHVRLNTLMINFQTFDQHMPKFGNCFT